MLADFPMIADPTREIATAYGMIDPDTQDKEGLPLTCRSVFIIGESIPSSTAGHNRV